VVISSHAAAESESAEPTSSPSALYVVAMTVERTPQAQLALDFA
jgi:hypothetical protein